MDRGMFGKSATGRLVAIQGTDARKGPWEHRAFQPDPLPDKAPELSAATQLTVADARAALAALDSTARRLPNPTLLRTPTLRLEAQSTSALEGTYAPISDVLTADEDTPSTPNIREILNYERMANHAFGWLGDARPITVTLLSECQQLLVLGTPAAGPSSGRLRDVQVVIGRRPDAKPGEFPITAARFIPPPPGPDLDSNLRNLTIWMRRDHSGLIDPVVGAGMAHYQFETLHPFHDGNGRLGRLLIVLQLLTSGILIEPTLTVSPWFEARRAEYYDNLLAVSTDGAWDRYIQFFALGLRASADRTHHQMLALMSVQEELKEAVRTSPLRADNAQLLVDLAVANPSFTVRRVEAALGVSYGRANTLVGQLVDLGLLRPLDDRGYNRRFFAPRVLDVLLASW